MKKPNHLQYTILFTALALGSISLQAHAFGTADDIDQTAYTEAFKALDTDSSDTLSKSELKKEKAFNHKFSVADKNHDGSLDQQEYTDHRAQVEQKNVKRIASDSVITSKVKAKLLGDEGLKSFKVSVETHKGVVLLSGFVATEAQIKDAEKIAAATEGVKSVKNSLVLKKD